MAGEEDLSFLARYTYAYMRRFALGVLRLSPSDFGRMMVGDFFDTMGGYYEQSFEDYKLIANLVRMAVACLVSNQPGMTDPVNPKDIWRMPWDEDESKPAVISKEDYEQQIKRSEEFFKRVLNGNSNK